MHEFKETVRADDIAEYHRAWCACGWVSPYDHASTRFAQDDYDFHIERLNERNQDDPGKL